MAHREHTDPWAVSVICDDCEAKYYIREHELTQFRIEQRVDMDAPELSAWYAELKLGWSTKYYYDQKFVSAWCEVCGDYDGKYPY